MSLCENLLNSLLKIENYHIPIVSLHTEEGECIELIQNDMEYLKQKNNLALILISKNQMQMQTIAESVCDHLTSLHQNSNSENEKIQIKIDLAKINLLTSSENKIIKLAIQKISQEIAQQINSIKNIADLELFILIFNFDILYGVKGFNIAQIIRKQFKEMKSINFLITCHPQYMNQEKALKFFGAYNILMYVKYSDTDFQKSIINKLQKELQNLTQNANQQIENSFNTNKYLEIIEKHQALKNISNDANNIPILVVTLPQVIENLQKNFYEHGLFTRYEIFTLFVENYVQLSYELLIQQDENIFNQLQRHYQMYSISNNLSLLEKTVQEVTAVMQVMSWKVLSVQQNPIIQKFNDSDIQNERIIDILQILLSLSPIVRDSKQKIFFRQKQLQQFFVAQSIVQETSSAKNKLLDESNSQLNQAYISHDLEILRIVGEYVMEFSLEEKQYPQFFEVWYRSLLLSRKIRTINNDAQAVSNLKHLASNCMSLLASTPLCDLTERDFSECAICESYVCDRNLSGCNFKSADLSGSQFIRTNISKSNQEDWCTQNAKFSKNTVQNKNTINSICFSRDGKSILSSSDDNSIILWNLDSLKVIATFRGHCGAVKAAAFSWDGKMFASAGEDQQVKVWNIQNKKLLYVLQGHENQVHSVTFSPNSKLLASGGFDRSVGIWDVQGKIKIAWFTGHTNTIYTVAFSPDSKLLASGSYDKTIRLWDIQQESCIHILNGHSKGIWQVVFSPDGNYLVSGSQDCTVKLWNLQSYTVIQTLVGHSSAVHSVTFSPDAHFLASVSQDNTIIRLWDVQKMIELSTFQGKVTEIQSLSFSPDSKLLMQCSGDTTFKVWNVQGKTEITNLALHSDVIWSVALSADSKMLATGSADLTAKLWKVQSITLIATFKGHTKDVQSVAFSPDSKLLATGSYDQTVKLWDIQTKSEIKTLEGHSNVVWSVVFSPDGKYLASGSSHTVKLWDVQKQSVIASMTGHTTCVLSVAITYDTKTLASGSHDFTIKLWNIETEKEMGTLEGHKNYVYSVSFSPDGKFLASGSQDHTIKLWSVNSKQLTDTLQGHDDAVHSVAFSPDGKYLASGSYDKTIKLWNVENKCCVAILKGHSLKINSIAFSADSKMIASGSYDLSFKLWKINLDKENNNLITYAGNQQPSQLENEGKQKFMMRQDKEITIGGQL